MNDALPSYTVVTIAPTQQPTPRAPDFAPHWLRAMWAARRGGASCECPRCLPAAGVPLGLGVHPYPEAYRFHCAVCAWRSPWFEALADGRLLVLLLDVA